MTAQAASMHIVSRRALMGSSILVVESILRLGLVAAVSLWIAHELGPARFGLLNHVSALVAVFLWAAMLGLETPLTARLAHSATAAAAATLRLSKPGAMGMDTVRHRARMSTGRPGPSAPMRMAARGGLATSPTAVVPRGERAKGV